MAIVTISRKIGSYGEEIARGVALKLGYQYVSREEMHSLAQDCDKDYAKACTLFEKEEPSGFLERFALKDPSYRSLFMALNYELAARGNVVIMGRGAQVVLADVPEVFRVRVVAPFEVREERVAAKLNMKKERAGDYVRKHDRHRRSAVEMIFEVNLADWSLYDLVLNTARISVDTAVELICHGVDAMPTAGEWAALQTQLTNLAIAGKVESAIKRHLATSPWMDIKVSVPGEGKVILSGFTGSRPSRDEAVEIAQKFEGIKEVDNQIRLIEMST
jgi:cytidylate kinase